MVQVKLTIEAESDLAEIWSYIADDSPSAADRVVEAVLEKCHLLARSPELGPSREELGAGLRYLPVGNYVAFYRIQEEVVVVVRILHGARDLDALL